MRIDVAINPFDADVSDMVDLAVRLEDGGIDGIWVADHFSGSVVNAQWSRDPFVVLGAIAQATNRVRLGPLVANVRNRHPVQLASAINSVQSLAGDRVVLGIGSGAAPGSRFAVEHVAIGRELGTARDRRRELVDQIRTFRATYEAPAPGLAVADGSECPPVVVGASAWPTIEAAIEHADGVNLRRTSSVHDHIGRVRGRADARFEVSVLDGLDAATPIPWRRYVAGGVDRVVLGASAPFDPASLVAAADSGRSAG